MRRPTTAHRSPQMIWLTIWFSCWTVAAVLIVWRWRVREVSCFHPDRSCTAEEQQVLQQLLGRRIIFNDWKNDIAQADLASLGVVVADSQIGWPAIRYVELANQKLVYGFVVDGSTWGVTSNGRVVAVQGIPTFTYQTPVDVQSRWPYWQSDPSMQQQEVSRLTLLLAAISKDDIEQVTYEGEQVVVLQTLNQEVLLNPQEWEVGLQRWRTIDQYFDWSTLPAQIKQIDVRYRLPALRSARTLPRHIG